MAKGHTYHFFLPKEFLAVLNPLIERFYECQSISLVLPSEIIFSIKKYSLSLNQCKTKYEIFRTIVTACLQPCKGKSNGLFRYILGLGYKEIFKDLNQVTLNLSFHSSIAAIVQCSGRLQRFLWIKQQMEVLPISYLSVLFQNRLLCTLLRTQLSFTIVFPCPRCIRKSAICFKGHGFSKTFFKLTRDYSLESDKSHYLEWGKWPKSF